MDDDSLTFGSDAAGATPGSNSILAQPPLQGESPAQEGSGEVAEGMFPWPIQ
jgi:SWI/SNF related-matrix-associated actin-dependent regulator of chromatin subfamily C